MNIPIYRAKKFDCDKWVEGYLINNVGHYIITTFDNAMESHYPFNTEVVDKNTLAIHFPNMIDKNGKKIFASLSEDGVGGDTINEKHQMGNENYILFFSNTDLMMRVNEYITNAPVNIYSCKVTGIHKGE